MLEMREVMISIRGTQDYGEGEDTTIELMTEGYYGYQQDFIKLTYMETELTGLEGTYTTFEVRPSGVIMTREGVLTSQMVFEEGKKYSSLYETPFGTSMMGVDTRKICNSLGEHGGSLQIHYIVDFNHTLIGKNAFYITVKEIKS